MPSPDTGCPIGFCRNCSLRGYCVRDYIGDVEDGYHWVRSLRRIMGLELEENERVSTGEITDWGWCFISMFVLSILMCVILAAYQMALETMRPV